MRREMLTILAGAGLMAAPAWAAQDQNARVTDRDPNAMDIAKTPISDLNISKDPIPAMLVAAQERPYSLAGLSKCSNLSKEVRQLDAILGPDIDLPEEERKRISAGRVGKWVVSSFIPFRGLIREVSGANDHERKFRAAIQAGLARRGYLKGVGGAKGCKYPASPATPAVVAKYKAALDAEEAREKAEKEAEKNKDND
ncbi:hypothetical protein [Novosphingobium aquimarinum]|uniref:hypothetical protein n=1 Tax=Novosphingobium aquimarinum TaxID=2682494 RepID=UPI001E40B9F6|nr:hypothetical protein [Novosphingobium aquimarinum]